MYEDHDDVKTIVRNRKTSGHAVDRTRSSVVGKIRLGFPSEKRFRMGFRPCYFSVVLGKFEHRENKTTRSRENVLRAS